MWFRSGNCAIDSHWLAHTNWTIITLWIHFRRLNSDKKIWFSNPIEFIKVTSHKISFDNILKIIQPKLRLLKIFGVVVMAPFCTQSHTSHGPCALLHPVTHQSWAVRLLHPVTHQSWAVRLLHPVTHQSLAVRPSAPSHTPVMGRAPFCTQSHTSHWPGALPFNFTLTHFTHSIWGWAPFPVQSDAS